MLLLSSADFLSKIAFSKILSGTLPECQTVWILIRPDILIYVAKVISRWLVFESENFYCNLLDVFDFSSILQNEQTQCSSTWFWCLPSSGGVRPDVQQPK